MKADEIVFAKNNKLYLDTSMTQSAFSKSRLTERLREEGFIATCNGNGSWDFSSWTFNSTLLKTSDDENQSAASRALTETVLLEGDAFDGCTLKNYFDEDDGTISQEEKAKVAKAAAITCAATESAIDKQIKLCNNGAGGIFISTDFKKIIFLPEDLFETAVTCRGDVIYSEYEGKYLYRTLAGSTALRFTQSVIAYRALTGTFPFANNSTVKRHEDLLDHNFVHLSDMIYGLNYSLAFFVDNSLMRSPHIETHTKASLTDKRSFNEKLTTSIKADVVKEYNEHEEKAIRRAGMKFPLTTFYKELGLTEAGDIPETGRQNDVIRKADISQEAFEAEAKKTARSFNKSLLVKRWFRHNRVVLTGVGIGVAVVAFFSITSWNDNQKNPTTKSLTSTEAVQMFYSAMNNLDVVSAQQSSKGRNMNKLVDVISNFYVTSKQRSAYQAQNNCVTPASWLCFNNNGNYTIFGLSQFTIDGKEMSLNFQGPLKNTHPAQLTKEADIPLVPNATTEHTVHYYLLYTEGLDELHVVDHTDKVTLSWSKNRWLLTNVAQGDNDSILSYQTFTADYKSAFEETSKDILKTAKSLSNTYKWLNTADEIREAKDKLDKEMSIF